jgi:hypothetical protein
MSVSPLRYDNDAGLPLAWVPRNDEAGAGVREHAEAVLTYNRLAEQFGLTPMARTRLGMLELQRQSSH